jgi:hypothetical protein
MAEPELETIPTPPLGSIVTTPAAFNTRSQKTQCPPEAFDTTSPTYNHDGNLIDTPCRRSNNKPKESSRAPSKKCMVTFSNFTRSPRNPISSLFPWRRYTATHPSSLKTQSTSHQFSQILSRNHKLTSPTISPFCKGQHYRNSIPRLTPIHLLAFRLPKL